MEKNLQQRHLKIPMANQRQENFLCKISVFFIKYHYVCIFAKSKQTGLFDRNPCHKILIGAKILKKKYKNFQKSIKIFKKMEKFSKKYKNFQKNGKIFKKKFKNFQKKYQFNAPDNIKTNYKKYYESASTRSTF